MQYETSVYWNKGAAGKVNQDSLLLLQARTARGRILLTAVCDGTGRAGEYASGYITEEIMECFERGLTEALGKKKPLCAIRRMIEREVCRLQCSIHEHNEKEVNAIGTTLSMLILWEKKYMLWNLGNSRIYYLLKGKKAKIRRLGFRNEQKAEGAEKYIGSGEYFLPYFETGTIKSGDAFLLCSNAFMRRLNLAEAASALSPYGMTEERCKRRLKEIGEAAVRRGERDNMSSVYIRAFSHKKKVKKGQKMYGIWGES